MLLGAIPLGGSQQSSVYDLCVGPDMYRTGHRMTPSWCPNAQGAQCPAAHLSMRSLAVPGGAEDPSPCSTT